MSDTWTFELEPRDDFNRELLENVHPEDWQNPEPASVYNLVVVGAGTAGLISALGAAGLGAKVALVERHLMGGDCLNVGCVPSKSLIRPARLAHEMHTASRFGLPETNVTPAAFTQVMERLRGIRAGISHHDSARRCAEAGVDVFFGKGRFTSRDRIEVEGQTLRFKKAVIAAGASAVHPDIEGLKTVGYRTNETIFNLTQRPGTLLVVGGGPIGCELAQAFSRLGSKVTIVQKGRFLPREDPDASALLGQALAEEGIGVRTVAEPIRFFSQDRKKAAVIRTPNGEETIVVDEILIGAGRRPNVEGLNLEEAGIAYDARQGVQVNDRLQTTNPRVYAAGDICMAWKFTHAADAAARIVIQNALFLGRKRLSVLTMPWCTYTDPEIAHVGLYEHEAQVRHLDIETFQVDMRTVDRSVTDGEERGFIKVLVKKDTDRILGATIVSTRAGEIISEVSIAMAAGLGLGKLAQVIHPYPTQAEAVKRVADDYNRTRLTPFAKTMLNAWLRWLRR